MNLLKLSSANFMYCKLLTLIGFFSGENSLASLSLSKAQFEDFVRDLLLIKHYRVEVYSKPIKAANNAWSLEFKVK